MSFSIIFLGPFLGNLVSPLSRAPEFLERFVLTNVKLETIDKWRAKKAKRDSGKGKESKDR